MRFIRTRSILRMRESVFVAVVRFWFKFNSFGVFLLIVFLLFFVSSFHNHQNPEL